MALSYEKAGVSIDTADAAKKQMADTMATKDPRILHRPGSFAALFDASFPGIKEPVLVMKTEEPGSKQKIAFANNRPASIAYDMIHHLIDDIIVAGAQPLIVQDCIVCGKLQKDVVLQLVSAINDACRQNDCFLIGGETSEQPGVLEAGLYILSSSIVGVVEKSKIIDGRAIQNQKRRDLRQQRRLPANVAHAAQIAFAFFAHIGDQQQSPPEIVFAAGVRRFADSARDGQQRGQTSAIVGDSGALHDALGIHRNIFFNARRQHGIEMRRHGHQQTIGVRVQRNQNIAFAIDAGVPAEGAELGGHPLGARQFVESRRGDATKLQVDIVDPLLILRKVLERFAHAGAVGKIADEAGNVQNLRRHSLQCSGSESKTATGSKPVELMAMAHAR